jgi:hypothetical protein
MEGGRDSAQGRKGATARASLLLFMASGKSSVVLNRPMLKLLVLVWKHCLCVFFHMSISKKKKKKKIGRSAELAHVALVARQHCLHSLSVSFFFSRPLY